MTEETTSGSDDLGRAVASDPNGGSALSVCYIGLGSNLGDREAYLRGACDSLGSTPGIVVCQVSSVYSSEPWGYVDQRPFLNAVVEIVSELRPIQLFCALQTIERGLGRQKRFRWGPREIDLDLLLYGNEMVTRRGLVVPHPAMYQRAFVLAPLAELAPWLTTPEGETIRAALDRLDPDGKQITIQTRHLASAQADPVFDNQNGVD